MKKGFGILIFLLFTGQSISQRDIDFRPRELIRELRKAGEGTIPEFSEMLIPDSFSLYAPPSGKFFVIRDEDHPVRYFYVGRVYTCRADGCTLLFDSTKGPGSEYFDYFIFYDSFLSIKLVRIFNYEASHGHEITSRGWLRQFTDYDGTDNLEVGKNIDAVAGATISVYGITHNVKSKSGLLRKLLY
jgi:hypothetical protein